MSSSFATPPLRFVPSSLTHYLAPHPRHALILATTQRNSGGPRRSSLATAITFPRIIINSRHLRRHRVIRILATIPSTVQIRRKRATVAASSSRFCCPLLANDGPRRLANRSWWRWKVGRGRTSRGTHIRRGAERKIDIGRPKLGRFS